MAMGLLKKLQTFLPLALDAKLPVFTATAVDMMWFFKATGDLREKWGMGLGQLKLHRVHFSNQDSAALLYLFLNKPVSHGSVLDEFPYLQVTSLL